MRDLEEVPRAVTNTAWALQQANAAINTKPE